MSRAVARLEDRVGIRLFARTARAIALTEDGRRFYETVAPHVAAIEDAAIAAGEASTRVRGRLRINVGGGIGQYVLTPRLQPFLDRYPELVLELIVRDRVGDLVAEGFDACIRFGVPQASALKARLLLRSPIVTCASPAYLKKHGTPKQPSDIEHHRCILMRDPGTGVPFGWDFVRGKKVVSVAAHGQVMVNEVGPMYAGCLAGQGIAQLLDLYVRDDIASGRLVHVLPDWADETYPLFAYYPSPLVPKLRAFLDYVASALVAKP